MDNRTIAERLRAYANSLPHVGSNLYRARAYRQAALTVLRLERPVEEIVATAGRKGLEELPGIGDHLAFTIEGLAQTGEFRTVRQAV